MVLDGTAAIVTGASGQIGEATARKLVSNGVSVSLTGRRTARLNELAEAIERDGRRPHVLTCDLRSENEIRRLFRDAHLKWGRLDIVVNCAGYWARAPISSGEPSERWREMLTTNVLAPALICREAISYFDPERGGHIVNIGSTSGHRLRPDSGFYAATKFALRAVSESLRMELASNRSRTKVTLISPGRVSAGPNRAQEEADTLRPQDVAAAVIASLLVDDEAVINEVVLRHHYQVP